MHRKIGALCASFSAFALALNFLTPNNQDFWMNVLGLTTVVILMSISTRTDRKIAAFLQIGGLLLSASLAPESPGGPFATMLIIVLCTVLYYAYDGYRTLVGVKLLGNVAVVYAVMLLSLSSYPMPPYELPIRALGWSVLVYVFDFALWIIFNEEIKFHKTKIEELVKLNRDILESGDCHDATGKP